MDILAYIDRIEDLYGNVLPRRKPSRPIEDQYQDYKQVQGMFEPRTQMYIEKEMGFDEGGLATPKRGLVDEPGSYSQTELQKKSYYEKLSSTEKKRKIKKSIEFQKTEEGKKIRAEGFKRRKLAKDPLSAVDKKVLDRFRLNLKYSKNVNDIIKDHGGMRPNPETLSELIELHFEVDPDFQNAWKKVYRDKPFTPTNLSPAGFKHTYDRAMKGTTRVTADNFKKEIEKLLRQEVEGTGTTYDEFMENDLRFNETYLNDNYIFLNKF